jgi:hypothetical protein
MDPWELPNEIRHRPAKGDPVCVTPCVMLVLVWMKTLKGIRAVLWRKFLRIQSASGGVELPLLKALKGAIIAAKLAAQ